MSAATELIKKLIASGMTQMEISRRTQIPQPRLSRWANGGAPAGADDALKLAELERQVAVEPAHAAQPTQGAA